MGNHKPRWGWTGRAIGTPSVQVLKFRPKPPRVQVITHGMGPRRKRK